MKTLHDDSIEVTPAEVVPPTPVKKDNTNTWLWIALGVLIVTIALFMWQNYKANKKTVEIPAE